MLRSHVAHSSIRSSSSDLATAIPHMVTATTLVAVQQQQHQHQLPQPPLVAEEMQTLIKKTDSPHSAISINASSTVPSPSTLGAGKSSSVAPSLSAPSSSPSCAFLSDSYVHWILILLVLCFCGVMTYHWHVESHRISHFDTELYHVHNAQDEVLSCVGSSFEATPDAIVKRQLKWNEVHTQKALLPRLRNRWIHLVGDSTLRAIYWELVALLQSKPELGQEAKVDQAERTRRLRTRHADQQIMIDSGWGKSIGEFGGKIRLTFHWSPYVNNVTSHLQTLATTSNEDASSGHVRTTPDFVLCSAGLWNLLYDPPRLAYDAPSSEVRFAFAEELQNKAHKFEEAAMQIRNEFLRAHNGWQLKLKSWKDSLEEMPEKHSRQLNRRAPGSMQVPETRYTPTRNPMHASLSAAQQAVSQHQKDIETLQANNVDITSVQVPKDKSSLRVLNPSATSYIVRPDDALGGYKDWEERLPMFMWLSSPSLLEDKLTFHRKANPLFRNQPLQDLQQSLLDHFISLLPMLNVNLYKLSSFRGPNTMEPMKEDGVHSQWAATNSAFGIASFLECLTY